MPFFSIVTIGCANVNEILATLDSVNSQEFSDFEHIVVISRVSLLEKEAIRCSKRLEKRVHIFDEDTGIYSAMNIGTMRSNGRYLLFMNSGDFFSSKNSLSLIHQQVINWHSHACPKCYAFAGYQIYDKDCYLRIPTVSSAHRISIPHQSFIAPNPNYFKTNPIYFNENNPISADSQWIKANVLQYGCIYSCVPVSIMTLGGISNRPSLMYLRIQFVSGNIKKLVLGALKLALGSLIPRRLYYLFLAFLNPSNLYLGRVDSPCCVISVGSSVSRFRHILLKS